MEVHHHPDLHHRRKKFKEYVLEFLMIFLAVSLGFFAESFREHLSDRAKEKEYVLSLVKEIKEDTVDLHDLKFNSVLRLKGLDSLIALSKTDMKTAGNQRLFIRFWLYYLGTATEFKSYDATIQQLKNTGNLRLIQKEHAADSMLTYENLTQGTYSQASYNFSVFKDIQDQLQTILDFTLIMDSTYFKDGFFTGKPLPPFDIDPKKMRLFFNKVVIYRLTTKVYFDDILAKQMQSAKRLLGYLQKIYGIPEAED